LPAALLSLSGGVGHNENPFASMRRTHVGRSKARPFRVVPAFGQVTKDPAEESSALNGKETWDVLQDRDSRS
jgi:hypothetical protein